MTEFYDNIDDILAKKLANETTAEEEAAVQNWLEKSPDNPAYFKEFTWLWEQTQAAKKQSHQKVDTEKALEKLHTEMDAAPRIQVVKPSSKIFNLSFIMKAAAVFLIAFGIYNQYFKTADVQPAQTIVASAQPLTDTLTDGSVVTLNKKSGLILVEGFNKKERRMKLMGEAYFEVAHDATRPFVVEIQNVEVMAVGTAFNIDNVSDDRFITILVTDGKVKIAAIKQIEYAEKGEKAIYNRQTGAISIEKSTANNALAYKTRQFHFDETPLSKAVAELSRVYETPILIKNKNLENCPLVVDFDNKTLDEILIVLADTFSFSVEKNESGVVLIGGSCK